MRTFKGEHYELKNNVYYSNEKSNLLSTLRSISALQTEYNYRILNVDTM